jgi:VWFA-related protein
MRRLVLLPAFVSILAAAVGPDEVRVAYADYAPPAAAIFRAETRVVETAAVVRDANDRIVDGLQRNDFRIRDDGREREITSFSIRRGGLAARDSAHSRLIALLIDDVALRLNCGSLRVTPNARGIGAVSLAKEAAEKYVRRGLAPEDRISIIGFANGQMAPFTNDGTALLAAIRKVEIVQTCSPSYVDHIGIVRDLVDYMARFRGDRSIVIASLGFGGVPKARGRNGASSAPIGELVDNAIRAGIPIHTLGMWGPGDLIPGTLAYLSENTGGRHFHNDNDFDLGLKELLSPPETAYSLGFTPDDVRDGRYHSLKIDLPGRKGYAIEARPGYFAPDSKQEQPRPERAIDRAVLAADVRDEFAATATALPDRLVTGEAAVSVVAHLALSRLPFRVAEGRHVEKLRVVAALFDARGGFAAGKEGALEFALKDASLAELSVQGVNATLTIPAPPGSYRVRTVLEEQGGKVTAANTWMRIP